MSDWPPKNKPEPVPPSDAEIVLYSKIHEICIYANHELSDVDAAKKIFELVIAHRNRYAEEQRKLLELDGRIVGMHELESTFKFEGIPLTDTQRESKRQYVAQLEAQLAALNSEGKAA